MPNRRARAALAAADGDTLRKSAFAHDSAARSSAFAFRARSGRVDWAALSSVDVDSIVQQGDLDALQSVLDNVSYADLASEGVRTAADAQLIKFGRVAQLGLEYLLHVQDVLASALHDAQLGTSSQAYVSLDRRYRRLESRHASTQEQLRAAESELLNSRRDRSRLLWICAQKSSGQAKAHWCRLCTKVFDSKSSLQSHAARRHFEQQALACGECDEQIGPADTVAANAAANSSSMAIMDAKVLEAVSQLRKEFETDIAAQRQELEESKLRERALRAQIIEYGKAAEDARVQQRRQPQVVEMPNVEHIQQLATATASAVAAREVMKMDPRQLVQDLKDELVGSFTQKMTQLESQSGFSNDATIAAMRASMQRERESTVSEVKQMMQQLQQQLQQHYDDNIARLSAEAAAREAELIAEANAAKQVAAEAAAAAALAEQTASAAAVAAASASERASILSGPLAAPVAPQQDVVSAPQHHVISAHSLRDVSSSSAPHSPDSVSSFEGGAAVVVELPQRKLQTEVLPTAAAAAPLHLSSASEVDDDSDDERIQSAPEVSKAVPEESLRFHTEPPQVSLVAAAAAAAAPAPDSPSSYSSSSSSSSSTHTSATASPDEVKPARLDSAPATPPPSVRVAAHAKLCINDVLPAQALVMPQGYSGSPIMSRVLITVDEIQQQLQHVETFLSRKHSQAAAAVSSPGISHTAPSDETAVRRSASGAGGAAQVSTNATATSAVLAQGAMSELQRRREQQSLRGSVPAAPAVADERAQQAVHLRSLLLGGSEDEYDGAGAQPFYSSTGSRQQQRGGEPLIINPVARSSLRTSSIGPKAGSGALISDSDSDSDEGAVVALTLQRKPGVPSSPAAKADAAGAASSRRAAVQAARAETTSSSGETDDGSESDYEEDFDAESGSSSNRQQFAKGVQVLLQRPAAIPPPAFGSASALLPQKMDALVDREDLIGSDVSNSDNEVMAFGGRDLSKSMQQVLQCPHSHARACLTPSFQSSASIKQQQQQQQPSTPPVASRAPEHTGSSWAVDDVSDVEELA